MRKYILIAISLVAGAAILDLSCSEQDVVYKTVTETKTDTVKVVEFVEVEKWMVDTIHYPVYKDVYITEKDTVYLYEDTVPIDEHISVKYSAEVTGLIKSINFGIVGKYPVETKTITNTETITQWRDNSGLYIGAFATSASAVGVGLDYIRGKNQFGAGVQLDGTISISYKRKIL